MIEAITSRENKKIKQMLAAATVKGRKKYGVYAVEGRRMVEEAVENVPKDIKWILVSESFAQKDFLAERLDKSGFLVCCVPDGLFRSVSDTINPQGISALMAVKDFATPIPGDMRRIVVLDGVSEPGNLGAIIRTAEAAGVDALYLMSGCADIYNPKTVRSTMGSLFRADILRCCGVKDIENLKDFGFEIASTELAGSMDLFEYAKNSKGKKIAAIIGSEAGGVSKELLNLSDIRLRIPMCGKVESLNAAVAAGILMYALRK